MAKTRKGGIAETYIHIKDVPSEVSIEKTRIYLEENAHRWAMQVFKKSVTVEITVEEGSLKVWVLVGGIAIYELVAGYGSFRSGVDYIVSDAKDFSEQVIERFESDQHIPDELMFRTERRLGVPGKIQRFYKFLDKLNSDEVSNRERQEEIDHLQEEFIQIIRLLDHEEDKTRFADEVRHDDVNYVVQNISFPPIDEHPEPSPEPDRNLPLIANSGRNHDDDD